jgi:hypothetical protein
MVFSIFNLQGFHHEGHEEKVDFAQQKTRVRIAMSGSFFYS